MQQRSGFLPIVPLYTMPVTPCLAIIQPFVACSTWKRKPGWGLHV